jgi:hypothetical protein
LADICCDINALVHIVILIDHSDWMSLVI